MGKSYAFKEIPLNSLYAVLGFYVLQINANQSSLMDAITYLRRYITGYAMKRCLCRRQGIAGSSRGVCYQQKFKMIKRTKQCRLKYSLIFHGNNTLCNEEAGRLILAR